MAPHADYVSAARKAEQKCRFCGFYNHPHRRCPARNADCKNCGFIGHYARVFRAGANRDAKQAVSAVPEGYMASLVGAPSCLHEAVVDVTVQGTPAKALLDTVASERFIHEGLVREIGLKSSGKPRNISLASLKSSAEVCGSVQATVKVFNHSYTLRLGIISDLCADVILGQDFVKMHRSTTFKMGGRFNSFIVPPTKVCGVTAGDVEAPRLFQFLSPDVKPVATRSRRFNLEDARFVKDEVAKLLSEDIIEPLAGASACHQRRETQA